MFDIGSKKWAGISKLIEECGEVLQVCGKIIAMRSERIHFSGVDLKKQLEDELGDVLAAIEFVTRHSVLDANRIEARVASKLALFEKWRKENPE